MRIPKYCVSFSSSSRKRNEKIELNNGVKESNGIVKLNSESLIDLKKNKEEKIPSIIKSVPGIE
tara:strand:+ start:101 stop:292 length:192 start_codon:yes stop_codon:yes gene_type:complete